MKNSNDDNKSRNSLSQAIWRWHFYAGMIFAPFLLILAITGGIYLFKPQIESFIYKEYYSIQDEGQKMLPSEQLEEVKNTYPQSEITRFRPGVETNRSSR